MSVLAAMGTCTRCDQSCIAFNEDADFENKVYTSEVSWSTEVGIDYYIRVYGWENDIGPFVLRVFPNFVV